MNQKFKQIVDVLEAKYQELRAMKSVVAEEISSDTPVAGIYLFSKDGKNLYTGRTKRKISVRVRNHFSTADDCPFAWLLAREATGKQATYRIDGSRKELLKDPVFKNEYELAKEKIRKMDVRYVQESDPVRQALLEIYVAIASNSEYNDFNTH